MPRLNEFVEDFAAAVAALATTRDATQLFLRHQGSEAFESSPAAGRDGFEVFLETFATDEAFGRSSSSRRDVLLVLRLGHAPFATDDQRHGLIARDVERIMDVIEGKQDWSAGSGGPVEYVALEPGWSTDRADPSWWITRLTFRCRVVGIIASS